MAERSKPPERLKALSDDRLKKHVAEIGRTQQKCADSRMANASAFNNFKEDGGNNWALKAALRLGNMDPGKGHTDYMDLKHYVDVLFPEIANDLFTGAAQEQRETLDPFVQGKAAGKDGVNYADNPFKAKSLDYTAWANGWKEGQADLIKDNLGGGHTHAKTESPHIHLAAGAA